jgi:hypothetical protein
MTLTFAYQRVRRNAPSVPLGGATVQPRPVIPITLIGPTGTRLTEGLLDTGADECLFSDRDAPLIGLDLSAAPQRTSEAVGGATVVVRFAQLTFRIACQNEQRQWAAWVAFTSAPLRRALLGFGGFLQYFTAAFHGDREVVELTVNPLYPGT